MKYGIKKIFSGFLAGVIVYSPLPALTAQQDGYVDFEEETYEEDPQTSGNKEMSQKLDDLDSQLATAEQEVSEKMRRWQEERRKLEDEMGFSETDFHEDSISQNVASENTDPGLSDKLDPALTPIDTPSEETKEISLVTTKQPITPAGSLSDPVKKSSTATVPAVKTPAQTSAVKKSSDRTSEKPKPRPNDDEIFKKWAKEDAAL